MFTIDDIINTDDLEELFCKTIQGQRIVKSTNHELLRAIRNFGPISTEEIEPYVGDKNIVTELEKYGRYSLLNYCKHKQAYSEQ